MTNDGRPFPADLDDLLAIDAGQLSDADAQGYVGALIDAAGDASSMPGLDRAEAVLEQLSGRPLTSPEQARLHYLRANVWAHRNGISGDRRTWAWDQPAAENELLELRRAVRHDGFPELAAVYQAQVLNNLGNSLNTLGRFIEAIEAWDRALIAFPRLGMARGNRGMGLADYARAVYDPGHAGVLAVAGWRSLGSALADDAIVESEGLAPAFLGFADLRSQIGEAFDIEAVNAGADLDGHSLGRSKAERAYRAWCLDRRLFVNPLNDIGAHGIAARDVLTLPSIVFPAASADVPAAIRYFNVMKQEYASARFALYEGLNTDAVHFSDREVLVYNTLDYPAFSLAVERIKSAFRTAYATFDKAAFLLNAHFGLGHKERQVNFRNVWFGKGKPRKLHPALDGLANWPLRGLFWLSKDIFEDDFRDATEPDARALYELRNHLEHKFVYVHDDSLWPHLLFGRAEPAPEGLISVSASELGVKTLRMMKLARAVLIYLSLAIHAEERRREGTRDGIAVPMILQPWDDQFKRL